jgi:hypothetical protein
MSFWCHRFDQNSNKNIVRISALKYFVASWGLLGSFLGLSGDLVSNIIKIRKPTGSPKKLPGSPKEDIKTFRAEILTIFSLLFWFKR